MSSATYRCEICKTDKYPCECTGAPGYPELLARAVGVLTDDELDQAAAVYGDSRASRGHARSYDRAALRAAIDAVLASRKAGKP